MGTLLMEVAKTSIGSSSFKFELNPTGKKSADLTNDEFNQQIIIGQEECNSKISVKCST